MSKRIATSIAGFTTLAILTGCVAEPPYRGECYGNNCRHERGSGGHLVAMNWQMPVESERAAD